jgi:membrane protein DedA with SNARE-associated domain
MFEWILSVITTGGYAGIFFLMVLENLFPPIPSEVIIPLAGYAAAGGQFSLPLVILAASFGAVVGTLPWYALARAFGTARLRRLSERYGRIMTLSSADIDRAEAWFSRRGAVTVLLGRLIPTVRTFISIPAGMARMPLSQFLAYSFVGSFLWTALLAILGYLLGTQREKVEQYVGLISDSVIVLAVLIYTYRVITFKEKKRE